MRSLDDISNEIVEKEKELKETVKSHEIVSIESHEMAKDILKLRTKKKDLDIALEKSRNNKQRLMIELRILKEEYWSLRNG